MRNIDMYKIADFLLKENGARMTAGHKSMFREFIVELSKSMGYESNVEDCFFAKNVVVGDPKTAEIVLTAHYDTAPNMPYSYTMKQICALGVGVFAPLGIGLIVSGLSDIGLVSEAFNSQVCSNIQNYANLIDDFIPIASLGLVAKCLGLLGFENKKNYDDNTSGVLTLISLMNYYKDLPENERKKIAFVFFDNEEKGLIGSLCYRTKHSLMGTREGQFKRVKDQSFINLDCVGVGKRVNLFYTGSQVKPLIREVIESFESKERIGYSLNISKSSLNSMSDHISFVGSKGNIMILCDDEGSRVKNRIHSKKDIKLNLENIGEISDLSAETINKVIGIDPDKYKLNREVFKLKGQMVAK